MRLEAETGHLFVRYDELVVCFGMPLGRQRSYRPPIYNVKEYDSLAYFFPGPGAGAGSRRRREDQPQPRR